ncbi:hypothetical protein LV779_08730 [Streptomyces thinghirensis]|nr:hypothetical protein [Streptomyces thinghirensis]
MRAAVTLCAAAALAVPLGTASAAPPAERATSSQQTRDPVLVDRSRQPEVRPEAFLLACGDGNSRLVSLHWFRWDANAAVGRGSNAINDCDPYCAAGTFHLRIRHRPARPAAGTGEGPGRAAATCG